MMKEEDNKTKAPKITETFNIMVPREIREKYYFMENRVPKLGEIRGKILFIPRWDYKLGD